MELVYMDGRKEPYTTHDIIAECAEVENISVRKLIDKHKTRLESFGVLSFEIHKPEKGSLGGRPRKVYRLNEQQATLLVTYLGNTDPVLNFKTNLVEELTLTFEQTLILLAILTPLNIFLWFGVGLGIVIQKLEEFQKCIDELLKKLEPDDREIFELRWGHQKRDWEEIYHTMQLGKTGYLYKKKSSILKRREIILDSFAKLLYI